VKTIGGGIYLSFTLAAALFASDRPRSASRLHHDDAGFEFSFARAFEKLIDAFLNSLTDLLLSTFLAYRAGDILDFNEVGLHCRSG
jgi:hypothetical protein